jgi:multicomponent Na+:H+ antiporter subunit F
MADYLTYAALAVLLIVAAALVRILRGPSRVDRLMSVQLLGSGSVAILLLLAAATGGAGILDTALTIAILAALAGAAFSVGATGGPAEGPKGADEP